MLRASGTASGGGVVKKNPASRKLYNALAEDLRIERKSIDSAEFRKGFDYAVDLVADALKRDNSAFDKERFLRACGIA